MKKLLGIISLFLILISCGSDEDSIQKIDQVVKIYIQNSEGDNLLNKENENGYSSVQLFDIGGEFTSQTLKGYSIKSDSLNNQYIEYNAGGTRNLIEDLPSHQIYQSNIVIAYFLKGESEAVDVDELLFQYIYTPNLFQIQSIDQNGNRIFTKEEGKPNFVYIVK